jgi:hypothetical protein
MFFPAFPHLWIQIRRKARRQVGEERQLHLKCVN